MIIPRVMLRNETISGPWRTFMVSLRKRTRLSPSEGFDLPNYDFHIIEDREDLLRS